jgi:hypothetical protein
MQPKKSGVPGDFSRRAVTDDSRYFRDYSRTDLGLCSAALPWVK